MMAPIIYTINDIKNPSKTDNASVYETGASPETNWGVWGGECLGFGSEYSSDVTGDGPEDEGQRYGAYGGYDEDCPSDDDGDETAGYWAHSMEPSEDSDDEFEWDEDGEDGEYDEDEVMGEADWEATCEE